MPRCGRCRDEEAAPAGAERGARFVAGIPVLVLALVLFPQNPVATLLVAAVPALIIGLMAGKIARQGRSETIRAKRAAAGRPRELRAAVDYPKIARRVTRG